MAYQTKDIIDLTGSDSERENEEEAEVETQIEAEDEVEEEAEISPPSIEERYAAIRSQIEAELAKANSETDRKINSLKLKLKEKHKRLEKKRARLIAEIKREFESGFGSGKDEHDGTQDGGSEVEENDEDESDGLDGEDPESTDDNRDRASKSKKRKLESKALNRDNDDPTRRPRKRRHSDIKNEEEMNVQAEILIERIYRLSNQGQKTSRQIVDWFGERQKKGDASYRSLYDALDTVRVGDKPRDVGRIEEYSIFGSLAGQPFVWIPGRIIPVDVFNFADMLGFVKRYTGVQLRADDEAWYLVFGTEAKDIEAAQKCYDSVKLRSFNHVNIKLKLFGKGLTLKASNF